MRQSEEELIKGKEEVIELEMYCNRLLRKRVSGAPAMERPML
jgi:hypothetical protein